MPSAADLTVVDYVLSLDDAARAKVFLSLGTEDREALAQLLDERLANPLFKYRHDHAGFVKHGLGEGTWSGQDRILEAVDKYQRVVVVATHSIGKSHISSRVVLGTGCTWPAGLARITTTATNYRQVSNILWPYIRRTHLQYDLPGTVAKTPAWKMGGELIADGFSAAASDETATQGMHANGEFLLVVDEAGGISDILGRAFNALLTSEDAHALVIGNAPTDREGSWFEMICKPDSGWHVITISAFDTPAFTGEVPDWCTTCPPTIEKHRITKHLTSPEWVKQVEDEFGKDSPFYIARVEAKFPKGTAVKTLPLGWLESTQIDTAKVTKEDFITAVPPGPIELGVDVASDGGDELAVAWLMSNHAWIGDATSGPSIASPRAAAQFVLAQIVRAELMHKAHGITTPVRVKYDAIGLGWGMGGMLEEYRDQGRHSAELIPVDVSEQSSEPEKYRNQRAEMWWSFREWIEPLRDTGERDEHGQPVRAPLLTIHMGMRELAQLNEPGYKVTNGRITIEAKEAIRKRGRRSPDRGEAILLAKFNPPLFQPLIPSVLEAQEKENAWDMSAFTN